MTTRAKESISSCHVSSVCFVMAEDRNIVHFNDFKRHFVTLSQKTSNNHNSLFIGETILHNRTYLLLFLVTSDRNLKSYKHTSVIVQLKKTWNLSLPLKYFRIPSKSHQSADLWYHSKQENPPHQLIFLDCHYNSPFSNIWFIVYKFWWYGLRDIFFELNWFTSIVMLVFGYIYH